MSHYVELLLCPHFLGRKQDVLLYVFLMFMIHNRFLKSTMGFLRIEGSLCLYEVLLDKHNEEEKCRM